MTSATTRVFGLIGWPVDHSRSPSIHSAAIAALGLDAVYVPFPVPPTELERAIAGLRAMGIAGANVTLPHKERIASLLDALTPTARAIGAVNTIVREGDRLIGENTDAPGLVRALREQGVEPRGRRAIVLGAGGAARAAVHGLLEEGANVAIAARRLDRAEALASELGGSATSLDRLAEMAADCDLLVQATSATLAGGTAAEEFSSTIPLSRLPDRAIVIDLVYAPLETTLLRDARARGLVTLDGLGMLVGQAALSFERWTGLTPPFEPMQRAARESPRGSHGPT